MKHPDSSATQYSEEWITGIRTAITKLKLKDIVAYTDGSFTVLCDISMGTPRPIVPKVWRRQIFV